jgi:hypothetical protein
MMEKKDNSSLNELVNTARLFYVYLLRRWWLVIVFILLGITLGAAYYYRQKPKYVAVCTFILEEKSGGNSGLSGLASQFGLNIGGISGGSIFSGDNILNILKSKKVVEQVLLSKTDEASSGGTTLADLYLDFTGLKKGLEKKGLLNISFSDSGGLNPRQDSVLNAIYEGIVKNNLSADRTSKQGTIIQVQVTASNSLFARLMTERLVDAASKLYLDLRIGTAESNISQLQRRSDSLLMLLNNKSYTAAASQLLDINPGIKTAAVPVEIAMRDKTVLGTLYAEVTKNLEASKMLLSQQTPVIELLDKPEHLLKDLKKSLLFCLVVFSALTGFFYLILSFILFFWKQNFS